MGPWQAKAPAPRGRINSLQAFSLLQRFRVHRHVRLGGDLLDGGFDALGEVVGLGEGPAAIDQNVD